MESKEVYLVRRIAIPLLVVMLLSGSVFAIHDFYVSDPKNEGYSGERARERRIYDPFSRDRYFGTGSTRDFVNFGSKGPNYRITNTGAKSAYSSIYNLDTNSYSNRGRDPSKISNWDPGIRGYARIDMYANLLPYSPVGLAIGGRQVISKGTARVFSTSDAYGSGLNKAAPKTQVFIQAINLPPVGAGEVYEAWLFDQETEYALSLGVMRGGIELTAQLYYENNILAQQFESVMITRELYPDPDPSPGEIIIMGSFGPTRNEVREPTSYIFLRLR